MKESPEAIIDRFEGRRRDAQVHRIGLIVLATAELVLVTIASFSVFYFFYENPFFPLLLSTVFVLLPVWIGHRWARRLPSPWSKKEPNQPVQRNASTGSVSNFESPVRRG